MNYKSVLTFADKATSIDILKNIIEKTGESNLHLTIHAIEIAPPNPVYAYGLPPYGGMVIPDGWDEEIKAGADALSERASQLEAELQQAGISGSVTTSYCERSLVPDEVSQRACVNDLAILPKKGGVSEDIRSKVLSGILFKSPIGVILPNGKDIWPLNVKKVFIACDSGLESMRAIHQALPILESADEVTLGLFDPPMSENTSGEDPGVDVATWLSLRGCKVNVQQYPSGGLEIGELIELRARELGAGLVVMGAYGHSRMRQNIFGGTTATMIEQEELSVFFAH